MYKTKRRVLFLRRNFKIFWRVSKIIKSNKVKRYIAVRLKMQDLIAYWKRLLVLIVRRRFSVIIYWIFKQRLKVLRMQMNSFIKKKITIYLTIYLRFIINIY